MKACCCWLLFVLAIGCPAVARAEEALPRVRGGRTLVWPDGRQFPTPVFGLTVVGQLPAARKSPYLILAGRGCTDCAATASIYIHSPSDGPMRSDATQPQYPYPGNVADYRDRRPLAETRMFWGPCLPDRAPGVIWYHSDKHTDGTWRPSVYLVAVAADTLRGEFLNPPPALDITLGLVRAGQCRELAGRNTTSEP